MKRQHYAIGGCERAVVQDHHPADTQPRVERLHGHQVGQQHPRANHGEDKNRILVSALMEVLPAHSARRQVQHLAALSHQTVDHR